MIVKMLSRYYIAYGSNLPVAQMNSRCLEAIPIGTAMLNGYKLLFKGPATIYSVDGCSVPVVIWSISEEDEKKLDGFEGYPYAYEKRKAVVSVQRLDGGNIMDVEGFFYRKPDHFPLWTPRHKYFRLLLDAYSYWNFPLGTLKQALFDSLDEEEALFFLKMNQLENMFQDI